MAVSAGGAGAGGAIRAGRAFVELFARDDRLNRALDGAKARVQAFGVETAKVSAGLFAGGLAAGAVGLYKVIDALGDTAQIGKTAQAFGLTAEAASGLFGVLSANGSTNARENVESLVTLSGRVKDVMTGVGEESKKLFDGLSVSAEELSRLPIDEQFYKIHEAIMRLPEPVDRVNRLMLAFGEDGGKTLIGTLSQSTDALRLQAVTFQMSAEEVDAARRAQAEYSQAVALMGTIWRKAATYAAPAIAAVVGPLNDTLGRLAKWVTACRESVMAAASAVGEFLTPLAGRLGAVGVSAESVAVGVAALAAAAAVAAAGVAAAVVVVGPVLASVGAGVSALVTVVTGAAASVASVMSAFVGAVATVTAVVGLLAAIPAAVSAIGAGIAFVVTNPYVLLVPVAAAAAAVGAALAALGGGIAVVGGLAAAFLHLTGAGAAVAVIFDQLSAGDFAAAWGTAAGALRSVWDAALSWLDARFGDTLANVSATWGAVVAAVGDGRLGTAAALAFDGLRVEWARLTLSLTDQWNGFKATFVDGWHRAVKEVELLWLDFDETFVDGFYGAVKEVELGLADLKGLWRGDFDSLADIASRALSAALARVVQDAKTAGRAIYDVLAAAFAVNAAGLDLAGEAAARAVTNALAGRAMDGSELPRGAAGAAGVAAERGRIEREFRDAQAGRERSRAADLDAAREDLSAEETRAADRRVGAFNAASMDDFFGRMMAGFPAGGPRPVPGAAAPAALGASITSFGGYSDTRQEFGGGGIGRQMVEKQKEGNRLLIDIRNAIRGLPGPGGDRVAFA
jgi:hypothetical protein